MQKVSSCIEVSIYGQNAACNHLLLGFEVVALLSSPQKCHMQAGKGHLKSSRVHDLSQKLLLQVKMS